MNDYEKSRMGAKTLVNFFEQFGDDVYSTILLEVLLEGIFNEESVFVSGEQEQTGDQDGDNHEDGDSNVGEIEGCQDTEPPTDLGEEDIPTNP